MAIARWLFVAAVAIVVGLLVLNAIAIMRAYPGY